MHSESDNYFEMLLDEVFDVMFVKDLGVTHAEHIFHEVLNLVRNNTNIKEKFLVKVKSNLLSDERDMTRLPSRPRYFIDPDLIFFIAHMTKYDEFEAIAIERKEKIDEIKKLPSNIGRDYSDLLLDALNDSWEDKMFYNSLTNFKQ